MSRKHGNTIDTQRPRPANRERPEKRAAARLAVIIRQTRDPEAISRYCEGE